MTEIKSASSVSSKFFELLVEMISLLVGEDSVGVCGWSVENDVGLFF